MIDDLPPLPEKEQIDKHLSTGIVIRGYTSAQMQAYASAAIAAAPQPQPVLSPPVPPEVVACLHAYGDSRADDDGLSGLRIAEAIVALRRWAAAVKAAAPQQQPVQQEPCPECDGTGAVAGSQAHFPCPLCTSLQAAQPLSDDRLCEAMRKAADELLDHIYEFGTISEGVNPRLLAVGRSIEQAHGITKGTT